MPSVLDKTDGTKFDVLTNETILQAALRTGRRHESACGGNARCTTCRVVIIDGLEHCSRRNERERALGEQLAFPATIRLACQTTITGDVTLRRPVEVMASPESFDQAVHGSRLGSAGEEKRVAVLFSDIVGFMPFAESLPPYDVIHALNRYLDLMDEVIRRNDGLISDYVGDGVLAVFGLEDSAQAPLGAVRAGLEMFEAVKRLNPYLEDMYGKGFQIRVGVHHGDAVVGAIGAAGSRRLTAIGDVVNLASRVAEANRDFGTRFLVSEDTYAQVRDSVVVSRRIRTRIKGSAVGHILHEVVGLNGVDPPANESAGKT